MTANPLSLNPWNGLDNVHKKEHEVFQPKEEGTSSLTAAVDVYLGDGGSPTVRKGLTEFLTVTAGLSHFAGLGLYVYQDGGSIYLVNEAAGTSALIVVGLSASLPVSFHEHAGKIFWTNGTAHGLILSDGTATNWGLIVPPIATLGSTAGDLHAGTYRVAVQLIDGNGVRSGAPRAAEIVLDGTKDLTVTLTSYDANAAYARIFANYADDPKLYYVAMVAVGSLPYTITDVNKSNEYLETQFLGGPQLIPNIEGISSWRGFMLFWRDYRVAHSFANHHHLFDIKRAVWKLPFLVRAVAGAGEYCWVATARGLFRYTGIPGTADFEREPMDGRKYAKGSLVLEASKLPFLEKTVGKVAIFASEDGLVYGLPTSEIIVPDLGKVRWDVEGKTASICYHEDGDLAQILVDLE